MGEFLHDVRFGLRLLDRSRVFTITCILLLAIGISANTLIFSVLDALLLRELPVSRPEELVRVVQVRPNDFIFWELPYGLCQAVGQASSSLAETVCQADADVALAVRGLSERVRVNLVSENYFSSLGVGAQLGRVLIPSDASAGTMPAVLSDDFWRSRFHGDAGMIGRTIALRGHPFVIVGVLPRGFNGFTVDTSPAVRVPMSADRWLIDSPENASLPREGRFFAHIFGRLRPGVPLSQAQAEVQARLPRAYADLMRRVFPKLDADSYRNMSEARFRLEPVSRGVSTLRTQFSRGLLVLMAGVGLLLLMACANVAGLLLARSTARQQEFGVRLALGASPARIVRQLLSESLALALPGGLVGVLLAYAGLPVLLRALPPVRDRAAVLQPLAVHIDVDLRVLGFAGAITLLTALVFGVFPAFEAASANLAAVLRGGRTVTRRLAARDLMVMAQVAACTVLLIGAALLTKTLANMRTLDAGFDRDHIVTFTLDPGMKNYASDRALLLGKELVEKTGSLPQTVSTGLASRAVMRGTGIKATFAPAGYRISAGDFLNCSVNAVSPGYFETMGMRLVAGRDLRWADAGPNKPRRVVVNQAFVQRFFPHQDPIGRFFGGGDSGAVAAPDSQIIGVVSDARYRSLREEVPPTVYEIFANGIAGFVLHVRTRHQPEAVIGPVREALRSLDPELPFVEVRTLREEVETSLWQERLLAAVSSFFGAIAALLASIGLYGALDYAVRARTREIGVRVACGAGPARIAGMLVRETILLVASGAVFGFIVYNLISDAARRVLYDVRPLDPGAIAAAFLLIVLAAVAAAAAPIWRAARLDPASALRHE